MTIHHVAVWVEDLECLRHFYETYFNGIAGPKYINEAKGFSSYFIRFDGLCALELMHHDAIGGYVVISEPRWTGDGYYESCIYDLIV
jgi:lactoylglutathione lyase